MTSSPHELDILMADDDEDDRQFAQQALKESRLSNRLVFVSDGRELLDYLRHEGDYKDPDSAPRPGLILLDLNMPRMDGREALEQIKADPELRRIPIVVLTTSRSEEDIYRSYDLGASSFIMKPVTFDGLVTAMKEIGAYWFQLVALPPRDFT
ncbi:MAG: response regulator [Thermomicrobiales bacterium]